MQLLTLDSVKLQYFLAFRPREPWHLYGIPYKTCNAAVVLSFFLNQRKWLLVPHLSKLKAVIKSVMDLCRYKHSNYPDGEGSHYSSSHAVSLSYAFANALVFKLGFSTGLGYLPSHHSFYSTWAGKGLCLNEHLVSQIWMPRLAPSQLFMDILRPLKRFATSASSLLEVELNPDNYLHVIFDFFKQIQDVSVFSTMHDKMTWKCLREASNFILEANTKIIILNRDKLNLVGY